MHLIISFLAALTPNNSPQGTCSHLGYRKMSSKLKRALITSQLITAKPTFVRALTHFPSRYFFLIRFRCLEFDDSIAVSVTRRNFYYYSL